MKSQVLLPKIFNFPFTYNSRIENKIGNLVEVPFGSKKEIGVIWKNNYSTVTDFAKFLGLSMSQFFNKWRYQH